LSPTTVPDDELASALSNLGWVVARQQQGSDVRLRHPERAVPPIVPLLRELKRDTRRDPAQRRVDADELRRLL
jgi:predicted RNA binding protein YcfA (HicA-like mRNA interferase family)